MGCFTSSLEPITRQSYPAITENDKDDSFSIMTSNGNPSTIDDPITIKDGITLNALALSVWMGRTENFKVIKDLMGGKISQMEELFTKQGTSALEVIFSKGHIDFLRYYLPLFLMSSDKKIDQIESLKKPLLHIAVKNRHFEIISYLFSYFSQVCPPPAFDVHYIDPETGENSALITCRNLDLQLARFLFKTCAADFHLINKNNQNSMILAAINSSKVRNSFEFFRFLIEVVNIDVGFRFETVVDLVLDDRTKELLDKMRGCREINISEELSQATHVTIVAKGQFDGELNETELMF